MAVNEIDVDASVEQTFAVLADPSTYADWVVGAREIRRADVDWPTPGSTFHHTQGLFGPLQVRDTSSVLAAEPPTWLELEVRVRPWMVARTEFRLREQDGQTHVVMVEEPVGGLLARVPTPGMDVLLRLRNAETLRRLKRIAEQRAAADAPSPAPAAVARAR